MQAGPLGADPVVVVTAAGSGTRYSGKGHKLLQPLGGTTVLGMTLRSVVSTRLPLVVVATPPVAEEAIRWVAAQDVLVLPAAGTPQPAGMGDSIAAGVRARPHARGWLVLPADLPLVQPASIVAVARALRQAPVAVAQYRGRRGHPVGFAAELFSELTALRGDEGARRLMSRYPHQVVDVDDPGVRADLDTEEDLAQLRSMLAAHQPVVPPAPPGLDA